MTTVIAATERILNDTWRTHATSGPYPVRAALTVREVEDLLAMRGFVEFVCDEAPIEKEEL